MFDIPQTMYLVYRLSPFILVCYFILNSMLNQSLNGIVYLFGLLFASVLAVMFGKGANSEKEICNILTIGEDNSRLSKVPLSIVVFSYTFFYLLMFILEQSANLSGKHLNSFNPYTVSKLQISMRENVAVLIIFPLLIIIDFIWNLMNGCSEPQHIFYGVLIGTFIGCMWGMIIIRAKNPDLQILNVGNAQVCSRPSKTKYTCKTVSR